MANGEVCKTCGCQETEHEMPMQALGEHSCWKEIPNYRTMRKLNREQIREWFIDCGLSKEDICDFFYDVVCCPGFSTTRRPNKNWFSNQK